MRTTTKLIFAFLLFGCTNQTDATPIPVSVTQPPSTTSQPPETTTTTTTTVAPPPTTLVPLGSRCEELAPIALAAGWPQELLVDVLDEAYQESRCLNVIDGHPNFNGYDRGPMQINKVWLDEITAKYGSWEYVNDPLHNFMWAWEMYRWFDHHRGCGFEPWSRKCG